MDCACITAYPDRTRQWKGYRPSRSYQGHQELTRAANFRSDYSLISRVAASSFHFPSSAGQFRIRYSGSTSVAPAFGVSRIRKRLPSLLTAYRLIHLFTAKLTRAGGAEFGPFRRPPPREVTWSRTFIDARLGTGPAYAVCEEIHGLWIAVVVSRPGGDARTVGSPFLAKFVQ